MPGPVPEIPDPLPNPLRWPQSFPFELPSSKGPKRDGSFDYIRIPSQLVAAPSSAPVRTVGLIPGNIRSTWIRQAFRGNPFPTISAIDVSGGIAINGRTTGPNQFFVQVSACNVTATGSDRPYEDLEFQWNFGDPAGTETFTNPANGQTVNANTDQYGGGATYCYRRAGTYTITLTVRGKNGSGFATASTSALVIQGIARVSLGIPAPSAGTYTLTVNGTTTAAIAFDANAATRVTALQTALGATKVRYAGANCVEFIGALAGTTPTVSIDGSGLTGGTPTFTTVFSGSTASAVTVTEFVGSGGDFWYDGTNGNDSNDGLDPWGFALTGATYIAAAQSITKPGAFAGYNHIAATAPTDPWYRYNYIYLSAGTGLTPGLYQISSKVSDDTITLTAAAGAGDNGNTTSSTGPKGTAAHFVTQWAAATNNLRSRFRCGTVLTTTVNTINGFQGTSRRLHGYGSGANPVLRYTGTSSGNPILSVFKGDDKVFSGVDFDGNGLLTTDIITAAAGTVVVGRWNFFDGCRAHGTAAAGGILYDFNGGGTTNNMFAYGLWNCSGVQPVVTCKLGLFAYVMDWFFVFGCGFSGTGTNSVLDHHMYPDCQGSYECLKWIDFGPTTVRNYCCNTNATDDVNCLTQFVLISECNMTFTQRGFDLSNGTNDWTARGGFTNVVVEGNGLHALTGDGTVLYMNAATCTIRDNVLWGNTGGRCLTPNDTLSAYRIYLNYIYHAAGYCIAEGAAVNTTTRFIKNNNIQVPTAAPALCVSITNTTGLTVDGDAYYAPLDAAGRFSANSVNETFLQWQGLGFDVNGNNVGNQFVSPSTGNWLPVTA